jgi:uracil-DNA glycosylase
MTDNWTPVPLPVTGKAGALVDSWLAALLSAPSGSVELARASLGRTSRLLGGAAPFVDPTVT